MIAYVKSTENSYSVTVVEEQYNQVVSESTFSTQDEYETWRAEQSGVTIVELSAPGEPEPLSSTPSSATTVIPELPETSAEVEDFRSQMESSNLFYGAGDASMPEQPTETPGDLLHSSREIVSTAIDVKTKNNNKAQLDKGNFNETQKKYSQNAENSGLLNSALYEPVPEFKKCNGDVVLGGVNNQWLVFGRDRPAGYTTGYGPGKGDTQAGSIDIVVGRMSPHVRSTNRDGSAARVSPIFNYAFHEGRQVCDASRIYISQKTDIDSNFSLVPGSIGRSVARAGIALKSDGIRIIARDSGIKLVTHSRQLMNSQGGRSSRAPSGIDIIAGNDDSNLQPMVLGDNLVSLMREYGLVLSQVVGTITSLVENVAKLDVALATHFHPQAFPQGLPNIPSPSLIPVCAESLASLVSMDTFSTYAQKFKIEKIDKQYLSSGGIQSIRSSFNNVN